MLQDFLVRDPASLEELSITDEDHRAIRGSQNGRALQAILKFCIARMVSVENEVFEGESALTPEQVEGAVQARKAYKAISMLILHPDVEEDENE